ncbi:hypothetical protein [Microbacterium karelineae]|uniref:hypothetical protein n=1 Tax=Microbacterium karelineae TaxID=2654283 RepID=UPI0012EAB5A7|nr:hypothetical protein [Microbacterium karelineae]
MSVDDVIRRRPPAVPLEPVSGIVTAVSDAGILVTPIGQSTDHPIGPCRGPRTIDSTPIAPGMHVLVVFTTTGPWIVSVDG